MVQAIECNVFKLVQKYKKDITQKSKNHSSQEADQGKNWLFSPANTQMFHMFIVGNFIKRRKASKSEPFRSSKRTVAVSFSIWLLEEKIPMSNWYLSNWPLLQLKQQSGKKDVQLGSPAGTAADISTDADHWNAL